MKVKKNTRNMIIDGKEFMRVPRFIELTGLCRQTIKKYVDRGILSAIRIGQCVWIEKTALTKAIK